MLGGSWPLPEDVRTVSAAPNLCHQQTETKPGPTHSNTCNLHLIFQPAAHAAPDLELTQLELELTQLELELTQLALEAADLVDPAAAAAAAAATAATAQALLGMGPAVKGAARG